MATVDWTPEERAADARLRAAAPDLLAACKAFQNCGIIETTGRTADGKNPANCTCTAHAELLAAFALVDAAIAKAEGGQS